MALPEAVVPHIHSSDLSLISDPFLYYLTRRLGLKDAFRDSQALRDGGWFHRRFELFNPSYAREHLPADCDPQTVEQAMAILLSHRSEEISAACDAFGKSDSFRDACIEREDESIRTTFGWYDAAREVRIPSRGTFTELLSHPQYQILGREIRITWRDQRWRHCPLTATYDAILYHLPTRTLWVLDLKTHTGSVRNRLSVCTLEYQTALYLYILHRTIRHARSNPGHIPWDISSNAEVGGMIHLVFQKPTIRLSGKDRATTTEEHVVKSGKYKGEVRTKETPHGEPRLDLFVERCRHWYLGTGPHSDKAYERSDDPPVNFSRTHFPLFWGDRRYKQEFFAKTNAIYDLATRTPHPENFYRTNSGPLTYGGGLSPYADLFHLPVERWEKAIHANCLAVSHRDPEDTIESPDIPFTIQETTT